MFGAQRAYDEWWAMIEPVLKAGPSHPHYKAACHQLDLSWAFTFGVSPSRRGTSFGDSDSVQEKISAVCSKMHRVLKKWVAYRPNPRCKVQIK
jgi:hypothetical protein